MHTEQVYKQSINEKNIEVLQYLGLIDIITVIYCYLE